MRTVKPFVMGRRASLFPDTPSEAAASSVMYSIMGAAKENGLHPFRYMELLLETLPNAKSSDLESLLPWSETLPKRCKAPGETERPCRPQILSLARRAVQGVLVSDAYVV
jgi:hypothetical protein